MKNSVSKLVALCCLFCFCVTATNNVCKSIPDYATIETNQNCWYDSDVTSTPEEIVTRLGYPFEMLSITTEDGYILNMFRIPHNGTDIGRKRPPVLLHHGLFLYGICWMYQKKQSLPFVLSDNGFDVWIANARGSKYSQKHKIYHQNDPRFWDFSYHEMGYYDLPAVTDFIRGKTGRKISYVGHSMGSTVSYIFASIWREKANENLNSIVSLAPIAYMGHIRGFARLAALWHPPLWDAAKILGFMGITQVPRPFIELLLDFCTHYPGIVLWNVLAALSAGLELKEARPEFTPIEVRNYFDGSSIKSVIHYAQTIEASNRFPWFDYGPETNQHLYNSTIPPEYNVSNINVPVHLLHGEKDFLSAPEDVKILYDKLNTNKTILSIFEDRPIRFNHENFLFSKDLRKLNQIVLEIIKKY